MAVAAVATIVVFGTMKTVPLVGDAYQLVFGWLRWPLSATESWLVGDDFAAPANVHLTRDPTDLFALPMAVLAWWVHGRAPKTAVP